MTVGRKPLSARGIFLLNALKIRANVGRALLGSGIHDFIAVVTEEIAHLFLRVIREVLVIAPAFLVLGAGTVIFPTGWTSIRTGGWAGAAASFVLVFRRELIGAVAHRH